MFEIAIEDTFDAAHCLRGYDGACRRLHGHTYRVRAAFRFDSLDETGMALDFRRAKGILRDILGYMDHQYINELPEFSIQNPTAELIAKTIYAKLKANGAAVHSVSVWETSNSCATYWEDDRESEP